MREMVFVGEIFITEAKAGRLVFGCKRRFVGYTLMTKNRRNNDFGVMQ
jgi:hypothetical protein